MGFAGISVLQILMVLILIALAILPFWKIFSKAGFSPWLSLLMVVPIVNFIMVFYLAFASWPALRNQNRL